MKTIRLRGVRRSTLIRPFGPLAIAALLAISLSGCFQPQSQACSSGVVRAVGTRCSADGKSCVPDADLCGNHVVDPGEVCDDGNTFDGDGCDHNCQLESTFCSLSSSGGGSVLRRVADATIIRLKRCKSPISLPPTLANSEFATSVSVVFQVSAWARRKI